MVGNRVRVTLLGGQDEEGVLEQLDWAGAYLRLTSGLIFYPLHRIREIIDLGRPH